MLNFINQVRTRITGAADAPFVIGSRIPEKWQIGDPNAAYAAVNEAHVAVSLQRSGVLYAVGPIHTGGTRDHLHYQPAQRCRDQGSSAGAVGHCRADRHDPFDGEQHLGNRAGATADRSDRHQTLELAGGADAASFKLSDPYLAPMLR